MNSKQKKVLEAIFADPVSPSIRWSDIERLFVALGCNVVEGSGSRVRFEKDKMIATFHRPHPKPEALRYQVREARDFLTRFGAKP